MARYFAGNSLASFFRTSADTAENSTAGRFDSAYVPSCVQINGTGDILTTTTFSATGTVWIRYDLFMGGTVGSGNALWTAQNGTTDVFRVLVPSTSTFQVQYWNGSAWTNSGPTFPRLGTLLQTVVLKVVLNSSYELYVGGTLLASGSGWSGSSATITRVLFAGASSSTFTDYSQVMIADYDIRDSHYDFTLLNANNATNTGGAGTFTDVNETILSDATSISVSVVGNKMGQDHAALTLPGGYRIAAMVVSARGRVSGGVVTDGRLGIRSVANSSGSNLGYNAGYEPRQRIADLDPNGSIPWTQASYNAASVFEEAA